MLASLLASTAAALEIGQWDGTTQAAELSGPYEDPVQQEIQFGRRSYYLTPWRSYMDTWPASRFLQCLGTNFNVDDKVADAVAQLLGECSMRSARVEVGWGSLAYDDPSKLPDGAVKPLTTRLKALQKHGVRPLMLLNANSGWPCPIKVIRVKLTKPAAAGARELFVDKTQDIKVGYTGPRGQAYQTGFPIITAVEVAPASAPVKCELSAPLTKDLKEGPLDLFILRYQPFSGAVFEDGKPNPAAQETLDGWKLYVAAICNATRAALGTEGAADAGFDLEVWNEYTFGSQFLNEKEYHKPARKFKENINYSKYGLKREGCEIILPITIEYVNDPANKLPGVKVISGFANQRPWDNGAEMWPGQTGFSRHYYTGINPGKFNGTGFLSPETETNIKSGPVNALGKPDGKPDKKDWHTVDPGSFFIPTLTINLPEYWFTGYKTELMSRETQPFPNSMKGHFRYAHPGTGQPAEVWMTEFNLDRGPWGDYLAKQAGCKRDDPKLASLLQHVAAKSTLRSFVFLSHKGVHTINMFAIRENDALGMLPQSFYKVLAAEKNQLTDTVRAEIGPQLTSLKRAADLMKSGQSITTARPLQVAKLVEHKPRLVFKGDGTLEHPDRWNRDDFACLPFQLDAGKFAVGYYVVTRNIVHEWKKDADLLDPARYDMPEQDFDLMLSNVRGEGAKVSAFDPLTGLSIAAEVVPASAPVMVAPASVPAGKDAGTTITVRLKTTDCPRFLIIEESKPGPLISGVKMSGSKLSFSTNISAPAKVSWGSRPERASGGNKELPSGKEHSAEIGPLAPDEGVKIVVDKDGLFARWPIWGHDTLGVASFSKAIAGNFAPASGPEFPALESGKTASEFEAGNVDQAKWQQMLGGADNVKMELRTIPGDLSNVKAMLPATSAADNVSIHASKWNDVAAWVAEFRLDGPAHPGLSELHQKYFIAPIKGGHVVFSFRGSSDSMSKREKALKEITEGVKFK
jgi:hypothetical protein